MQNEYESKFKQMEDKTQAKEQAWENKFNMMMNQINKLTMQNNTVSSSSSLPHQVPPPRAPPGLPAGGGAPSNGAKDNEDDVFKDAGGDLNADNDDGTKDDGAKPPKTTSDGKRDKKVKEKDKFNVGQLPKQSGLIDWQNKLATEAGNCSGLGKQGWTWLNDVRKPKCDFDSFCGI